MNVIKEESCSTNSGWVAIRRGIRDHLKSSMTERPMTLREFSVFIWLVIGADKSTGAGKVNAAILAHEVDDLSYDNAKRVLKSLEDKKYIWRKIVFKSTDAYVYWINKYQVSSGRYRMLLTDLSQVFESNDISRIQYIKSAPETNSDNGLSAPEETQDKPLEVKAVKTDQSHNPAPEENLFAPESAPEKTQDKPLKSQVVDENQPHMGAPENRSNPALHYNNTPLSESVPSVPFSSNRCSSNSTDCISPTLKEKTSTLERLTDEELLERSQALFDNATKKGDLLAMLNPVDAKRGEGLNAEWRRRGKKVRHDKTSNRMIAVQLEDRLCH